MIRRIRVPLAALAAAVALVAGGCGGGGGGGGITGSGGNNSGVVEIHLTTGKRFSPSDVTVAPGTTVRWIADDAAGHTVTPDNSSQPGAWTSTALTTAGQTFDFTFTTTGDFAYHCIPHQALGMTGVIHVR